MTPSPFTARKKFGQHFLKDKRSLEKIVDAACLSPSDQVIEVGPGPGALTEEILKHHPRTCVAIEIDRQFWPHLEMLEKNNSGLFSLFKGDALRTPLGSLVNGPFKIVANLPYNIGTALLIKWLHEETRLQKMVVMLQKEVVERLVASPNTKAYGRLSILVQSQATVKKLFTLAPGAFSPPPAVDSSVVEITPHPFSFDRPALEALTQLVFQQRRKMLRVSLKSLPVPDLENFLLSQGIPPTSRPEEHSVDTFVRLSASLSNHLGPYTPPSVGQGFPHN